jgi:MinD superfamily P-loop ATPase
MTAEITVVSGKGGTGKTSVTAAFAKLAGRTVICDLDVDAADLHILLQPEILETTAFEGGKIAIFEQNMCKGCVLCERYCRFGAIAKIDGVIKFDPLRCEGCGVCAQFCPFGAIVMRPRRAGQWFRSRTPFGTMLHAELYPGEENSGLLVTQLREEARDAAREEGCDYILSDGPPGIGCPVISAVSGTGFVVIVTEPTVSGVHDLRRIADLCNHFSRPVGVLLNKADLNLALADEVGALCAERGYPVLARIPYEPAVVRALVEGRTLDSVTENGIADGIKHAWQTVISSLGRKEKCQQHANNMPTT